MREMARVPTRGLQLITFEETPGAWFCGAGGTPPELEAALARTAAIEKEHGVTIHLVTATAVCGAAHLGSALFHARRSRERGRARARDPKVELMLYLTGNRQIAKAMEAAGIGPKRPGVAMAIEGPAQAAYDAHVEVLHALDVSRDDSQLEATAAKAKAMGLSAKAKDEDAWEMLAIEKGAVLDLE
jgi:tRNA threonylcarbamoyladenosine modification (KEOPS) complex Cgi121 subunit